MRIIVFLRNMIRHRIMRKNGVVDKQERQENLKKIQELTKALADKIPPERMEGLDIYG